MKCDVCDEEFDTENELMQHKAKMHAGDSATGGAGMQGEGGMQRQGMQGEDEMDRGATEGMRDREVRGQGQEGANDEDLEEPDFPAAANQ